MTGLVEFMVAAAVLPLAAVDRFSLWFCAVWFIYYLTAAIWLKASFVRPRQEPHDLVLNTARPFVFSNVLYVVLFANPFILHGIMSIWSTELNTFFRLFFLALAGIFLWLACVATDYLVMRVLPKWSAVKLHKYRFSVNRLLWTNGCVMLLAVLLGLLVAIVPGTNALMRNDQAVNAASWKSVINDYVTWSREFHENVGEVQEDNWTDAGLEPVLKACENLDYPFDVARARSLDPTDMKYEDWLSLRENANAAKTQNAQETADTVRSFLTVGTENAWPLLDRVSSTSDQLGKYGCTAIADFLNNLTKAVEPPDAAHREQLIEDNETVDIVADIENILQIRGNLTKIAQGLDEINQIEKSIAKIDTKLQPFAAAVAEELKIRLKISDQGTVAAVKKINDILNSFKREVSSLGKEIKTIDAVVFGKDHDKGLEGMSFENIKDIAKAYQPINYPSDKDKTTVFDRIETSEGTLRPVIQNPMLTDEGNKRRAELEQLKSEISGFRADCENKGLYFIARNTEKIEEAWQIVLSKLLSQENELIRLVQINEPPGNYFTKCMEFINSFSESDAIRKAGLERFNQIKDRFVKAGGSAKSTEILYDPKLRIYKDCEDLKKKLTAFDEKRKQLDAKIDAIPAGKFDSAGVDSTKLRQSYVLAREALFTRTLPPAFEKPLPEDLGTIEEVNTFESNIGSLIDLLDYIAVLNAHLADFYLLDETLHIDGRSITIEKYAAKFSNLPSSLQNSSLGIMFESQETNLSMACDGIENTIASLKKIAKSINSDEIIRLGGLNKTTPVAQGPNRVLVRSAWKKLQSTGFDPGETISAQTVSNLEKWYAGSGREKMLVNDLKTSVTNVYKRLFDKIPATLESELSLIEENGVDTSGATYSEFKEFTGTVRANIENAKVKLKQEGTAESLDTALRDALKNLDVDRRAASQLAATVSSDKWDNNLYHITRFAKDWRPSTDANKLYEKYRRPDESFWTEVKDKQDEITAMNKTEDNKEVEGDLTGFSTTFAKKMQETVELDKPNAVKQKLIDALKTIEDKLIPVFCRNLQWSEDRVIFTDSAFNEYFEIVKLQGADESQPYTKKKWSPVIDWDKLRDKEKETALQNSFFADFDKTKPCWPKYIRSKKDPSVILRYIPANPKPFYMSIRETTYEQFDTFLKVHLNLNVNDKWTRATRTDVYETGKILKEPLPFKPGTGGIYYWTGPRPLENSKYPNGDPNKPVVWITFNGSQKYCSWLGEARLPNTREHRLAADFSFLAQGDNPHFAEKDIQEIAWKGFLLARPMERVSCLYPWGVIYKAATAGSGERMRVDKEMLNRLFPRDTSTSPASEKGIHDLIGNVWEWCIGEDGKYTVCGYSCLTPEEFRDEKHYILHGSGTEGDYKYEVEPCCDVGFRVVIDPPGYGE